MAINKQEKRVATRKLDISPPILKARRIPGGGHVSASEILMRMLENNALRIIGGVIVDINNNPLVEATVVTMDDLLALDTAVNDQQEIIVTNPANLVSGYNPAKFFCTQGGFKMLGGMATHVELTPNLRVTWPVAAWAAGALTLAGVSSNTQTKITGVAGHGLTAANQITAGDTCVYIAGTSGGTASWNVGLTKLKAINTDGVLDLTLDHPYTPGLGKPIIVGDTAGDASLIPVLRIRMPKFSAQYTGYFDVKLLYKNHTTAATRARLRYGVAGIGVLGGTLIYELNDASGSETSMSARVLNMGLAGRNVSTSPALNSVTGLGSGTTPVATDVDNVLANTDILLTMHCNAAGADRAAEVISAIVLWRY